MARILVVDDEENVRKIIGIQLRRLGHEATEAGDGSEAVEILKTQSFDTLITDLKMPQMDGLELLQIARKRYPQMPVIMITAHGTIDTAVEAMKRGAFDYITKPFNQEEFLRTIERAVRSSEELAKEFQRSRAILRQEDKLIGTTEDVEKVYAIIERVANNSSNVFVNGEIGTGKEVVGRLLHDKSARREKPLVRAYVSACPVTDQAAYLFGDHQRPGCFALAEDGTLYIDEVGVLSLDVQAQLFEALTSGQFNGPKGSVKVESRLVAASDLNVLEKIESNDFRKDLFYCLNVVPIYLPPLRERTQDIEPLADQFLKIFSKKFSKTVSHLDEEALFSLIQYSWPGNIRELENCVEYAVNVADSPVIKKQHLPAHITNSALAPRVSRRAKDGMAARVQSLEKVAIEEALRSSNGDVLKASQKLGVPPSLLEEKMSQLKLVAKKS